MKTILLLVAVSFLLTCCAKDRNLDDYRREKVSQELAKIEAVGGSYRGTIWSQQTNKPLGALSLTLQADTIVKESDDHTGTEQRAGLRGKIVMEGVQNATVVFKDGYYDYTNGNFKAAIPFQSAATSDSTQMDVRGAISNGTITGQLEVFGYPESGGRFTLVKDARMPDANSLVHASTTNLDKSLGEAFKGTAVFKDGSSMPLTMLLNSHQISTEQELLNVFMPTKVVQITLQFPKTQLFNFQDSRYDSRNGTLLGRYVAVSGSEKLIVDISCKENRVSSGWDCKYATNTKGVIFTASLQPSTTNE